MQLINEVFWPFNPGRHEAAFLGLFKMSVNPGFLGTEELRFQDRLGQGEGACFPRNIRKQYSAEKSPCCVEG